MRFITARNFSQKFFPKLWIMYFLPSTSTDFENTCHKAVLLQPQVLSVKRPELVGCNIWNVDRAALKDHVFFKKSFAVMCYKVRPLRKGTIVENPLKNNAGFNDCQEFSELSALKIGFTFYNGNKQRFPLFLVAVAKRHFILESHWAQASFGLIQHRALCK